MWRSLSLAIGITMLIVGLECLGVEKVVLKARADPPPPISPWDNEPKEGPQKTLTPRGWTPWSLMGTGAVVCLYSFTLPRMVKKDGG